MTIPNKLACLLSGLMLPGGASAQQRPNIILFLVDDMGWQETSVPFASEATPLNARYRTPNMERMAAMGVKFTQAYACAVSSPSRCSLLTGMNAARHRVTNWTLQRNKSTDVPGGALTLPDWNYNGIQPDTVSDKEMLANAAAATALPQILKDNGYHTIHCGKAHFGAEQTPGADPTVFGFDVNIAGAANGAPGSYLAENEYGKGSFHVKGLEKYYKTGTFLTEALTLEALAALEKPIAEGKPFYLYMSHYAIHAPYNADKRFTPNYREADGKGVYDEMLKARLNDNEVNHAALVEGMDKSLGDILDFLEARPETAANTILLFMSDNGGQAVGPRQGRLNRDQNFPARAGKGSAYDGGVHEPCIIVWPGTVEGGTVNHNRIMIEDFFPTIIEMAGVKRYETSQTVDGRSFVDVLRNPNLRRDRVNVWHYPNRWGENLSEAEGYGAYSAIMKGDYHFIYFWESGECRLYNLRTDLGEQRDLFDAQPGVARRLSKALTRKLRSANAQRPAFKAGGRLAPWPSEAARRQREARSLGRGGR